MELEERFQHLCRLCAGEDAIKIDIFGDQGRSRGLSKKIQAFLPFNVTEDDPLPKSLCFNCVYHLENAYDFRNKCIQATSNLEKYWKKIEEERQVNEATGRVRHIGPEVSIIAISPEPRPEIYEDREGTEDGYAEFSEESIPNPLDFVEVGVDFGDSKREVHSAKPAFIEKVKSTIRSTDRRWLTATSHSVPLMSNDGSSAFGVAGQYMLDDSNSNRRKNLKPRKISRSGENKTTSAQFGENKISAAKRLPTPGLIAISIGAPTTANAAASYVSSSSNAPMLASFLQRGNVLWGGHGSNKYTAPPMKNQRGSDRVEMKEQKYYSCLLCEKTFTLRSSLNRHFFSTHGIEHRDIAPQPQVAGTVPTENHFVQKNEYDDYLESVIDNDTIIFCEVCRREFQDRASLWLHMVHAHREEAAISCGICLKIFSDNISLIEHVNNAHPVNKDAVQRRYSCQVCGRQHDSRQKLLKHATLHNLVDNQGQAIQPEEMILLNNAFIPRECAICRKRFFNEEKLNQHIQNVHNSNSGASAPHAIIFKCELCVSSHATRMDRWWHMYHAHNGDNRITCGRSLCKKIFASQSLKEEHEKAHHEAQGDYTSTCEICGKLCESRIVFYKHMMNVHPKCLPSICGVCLKIFSSVPELRVHLEADHAPLEEGDSICCDICGRPYAERSKMLRHRRVHNVTDEVPTSTSFRKKDELKCSLCPDDKFSTFESVAEHRRTVHKLFVCDLCPKYYNGNNHLWKHVSKQHKGNPNVTCDVCSRTSASKAHLERHKLKYHSESAEKLPPDPSSPASSIGLEPHTCHLCQKTFRIRSLLKKHLKSCKGVRPQVRKVQPVNGVYPCSKCPKVFEFEHALTKHVKYTHVIHYCEVCEEGKSGFDSKKELMQHIREQHSDHPELRCNHPNCDKIFRLKADLKKHKVEHPRGYFSYLCEICGEVYSNKKKLRKHLQTNHKEDSKHMCGVCNALFPSIDSLVSHVRSDHVSVLHRPFTCHICGKGWSVPSKVIEHVSKFHGAEYKPCRVCWKIFTNDEEYKNHVDNHPDAEEKPLPTVRKPAATSPRVRNQRSITKELAELGVFLNKSNETGVKREALEDLPAAEKRLRQRYSCKQCKKTFRLLSELAEHRKGDHCVKVQPATSTRQLAAHDEKDFDDDTHVTAENALIGGKRKMWTEIQRIACGCCKRIWNTKKQLWQHLVRSHPFNSQFTCGICLKVCHNYYDLAYHMDAFHRNFMQQSYNKFACRVCGHYHNSSFKLENHKRMHGNTPPYEQYCCSYCNRWFVSKIYFYEHLRRHKRKDPNLHYIFNEATVYSETYPKEAETRYVLVASEEDGMLWDPSVVDIEYADLLNDKKLYIKDEKACTVKDSVVNTAKYRSSFKEKGQENEQKSEQKVTDKSREVEKQPASFSVKVAYECMDINFEDEIEEEEYEEEEEVEEQGGKGGEEARGEEEEEMEEIEIVPAEYVENVLNVEEDEKREVYEEEEDDDDDNDEYDDEDVANEADEEDYDEDEEEEYDDDDDERKSRIALKQRQMFRVEESEDDSDDSDSFETCPPADFIEKSDTTDEGVVTTSYESSSTSESDDDENQQIRTNDNSVKRNQKININDKGMEHDGNNAKDTPAQADAEGMEHDGNNAEDTPAQADADYAPDSEVIEDDTVDHQIIPESCNNFSGSKSGASFTQTGLELGDNNEVFQHFIFGSKSDAPSVQTGPELGHNNEVIQNDTADTVSTQANPDADPNDEVTQNDTNNIQIMSESCDLLYSEPDVLSAQTDLDADPNNEVTQNDTSNIQIMSKSCNDLLDSEPDVLSTQTDPGADPNDEVTQNDTTNIEIMSESCNELLDSEPDVLSTQTDPDADPNDEATESDTTNIQIMSECCKDLLDSEAVVLSVQAGSDFSCDNEVVQCGTANDQIMSESCNNLSDSKPDTPSTEAGSNSNCDKEVVGSNVTDSEAVSENCSDIFNSESDNFKSSDIAEIENLLSTLNGDTEPHNANQ